MGKPVLLAVSTFRRLLFLNKIVIKEKVSLLFYFNIQFMYPFHDASKILFIGIRIRVL